MGRLEEYSNLGVLESGSGNVAFSLSTRSTVGRSSRNSIVLGNEAVSGVHASIEWTADGWMLRDLGSRNGTFLNGARIQSFDALPIQVGADIAFGDPEQTWRLTHAGAPQLAARSETGTLVFSDDDVLVLPNVNDPELTLVRDDQRWEYELDSATRFAVDQTIVELESGRWTLLVPEVLTETTLIGANPTIHDVAIRFVPSRNEEHIEILVNGPNVHEHFDHRAHSYLLLTLARLRLEDSRRSDLPASEHGWIERTQLEDLLKIETQHLNLLIHRARRQFAVIGVRNSSSIVERRSGSSQIRIGAADVAVIDPT
jgi:pSer/pThr/pTyr-binding forkhead associated (FHA) protein